MNRPECAHLARAALAAACAIVAAHAPLCAAQPKGPPLFQVEVIAFAYNDASASEELFPRQRAGEASSSALAAGSEPLQQFDFAAALEIEPPAIDESTGSGGAGAGGDAGAPPGGATGSDAGALGDGAGPSGGVTPPGAGGPSSAAPGAAPSSGAAPSGDASGGAAADSQTPGLSAPAPVPEPLIGEQGFRLLGPESYKLAAAYAKIERLDAYRPLLHAAWIEPALPEGQAKTITTADLGALNPEGGVQLYASRYLHFTVDLRYRPTAEQRAALSSIAPPPAAGPTAGPPTPPASSSPAFPGPSAAPSPSPGAPLSGQYGADPLGEISLGPRLTMKASRRVAANEIQYFDHPYFGLLVLVTPYEPEAPTGAQDGVAPAPVP